MDRNTLLTKISGRYTPTKSTIILALSKDVSPDEISEIIESLKEFGPKDLSVVAQEDVLVVSNITQEAYGYFNTFGGNNYLLARVRAGDFAEHESSVDILSLENGLHFVLEERVRYETVKGYFSRIQKTDDWREQRAKSIAKSSRVKGETSTVFAYDDSVVVDNRFGEAYKKASTSGLSDLSRYLLQKHLEELHSAGKEAADKGYAKTLESIGRHILEHGTKNSAISEGGKTHVVFLSTYMNPFTMVVGLEKRLYKASGQEVQLDYNDKRIFPDPEDNKK